MHSSDSSPRQTTLSHSSSNSVADAVSNSVSKPQATGKAPIELDEYDPFYGHTGSRGHTRSCLRLV